MFESGISALPIKIIVMAIQLEEMVYKFLIISALIIY